MLLKFNPDMYVEKVADIPFQKLYNEGKRFLLIDLDNTLVPHDIKVSNEPIRQFIKDLKDIGFKPIIFSNNTEKRVSVFCQELNVEHYGSRRKPLLAKYKRLMKIHDMEKDQMVAIGDQLLTDVYGGNKLGVTTVLVKPIAQRDILWTKVNRSFENIVYKMLSKKGLLKRGEFRV
jgi:HAD superfamily phosphatase (TIGR01668 family)